MDLTSRLRSIVRGNGSAPAAGSDGEVRAPRRELTYEPDGGYHGPLDLARVADALGGRHVSTPFGSCLVIDRRYEADRRHGGIRIEECELQDVEALRLLDPDLFASADSSSPLRTGGAPRAVFVDLETTGLSGGAGTIAFLVGCGYFDLGAFQVRQFLLTSHSAERALLAAVAEFFDDADLVVTYNGKTFDLPVMETRWLFHRMEPPLDGVPHFDMLHPARRLWRGRSASPRASSDRGGSGRAGAYPFADAGEDSSGCRLTTLERTLFEVKRVGDVPGFEIPGRFFNFVRSGDPRPLEPVLEHNRLDLVSLAAVTAHAARLARTGHDACRDAAEALALGRVYERAGRFDRAEGCYRHASEADGFDVKTEALYRLGLRLRRERRFEEAAQIWRELLALADAVPAARRRQVAELRQFAAEALAIHLEHRRRDLEAARQHALLSLEGCDGPRAEHARHRLARLDRKMARKQNAQLFVS